MIRGPSGNTCCPTALVNPAIVRISGGSPLPCAWAHATNTSLRCLAVGTTITSGPSGNAAILDANDCACTTGWSTEFGIEVVQSGIVMAVR